MTFMPKSQSQSPSGGSRQRSTEWHHGLIAILSVGLLAFVILVPMLLLLLTDRPASELTALLGIILPPVTGLVGTVVGFYYGSTSRRD